MIVLDASALLALMLEEPGCDMVRAHLDDAAISAVNLAEVYTRIAEKKGSVATARSVVEGLGLSIYDFNHGLAEAVADLRPATRSVGLSLGDRTCLALAKSLSAAVLTSDRRMAEAQVGLDIRLIR
jgi:PIN domain nuclease of toxin-antitoxin system